MWIKWSGLILFYLNGLKAPKQLVGKNWITLAISDSVSTVLALWQGNHDGFYLLLWITSVGPKRVWPTCSATSSCPLGGPPLLALSGDDGDAELRRSSRGRPRHCRRPHCLPGQSCGLPPGPVSSSPPTLLHRGSLLLRCARFHCSLSGCNCTRPRTEALPSARCYMSPETRLTLLQRLSCKLLVNSVHLFYS